MDTVVCQSVPQDVKLLRTDVDFQYVVETSTVDGTIPQGFLDKEIPEFVAMTAISNVADDLCALDEEAVDKYDEVTDEEDSHSGSRSGSGSASTDTAEAPPADASTEDAPPSSTNNGKDDELHPNNRHRLTLARLLGITPECIISVSSGEVAQRVSECTPSLDNSVSCDIFADQFSVLHTEDCTAEEVTASSMALIEEGIESGSFLSSVNALTAGSGVTVTLIEMYGDSMVSSEATAQTGLSAGGKSAVAIFVLAAVGMVGFFIARHRNRNSGDDEKSVHTQWSNKTDDNSYLKPDWHDIFSRHSKLDVHKCKSALCEVCSPNLGVVHTLRVPRGTNVHSLSLDNMEPLESRAVSVSRESSSRPAMSSLGGFEVVTDDDEVPSSTANRFSFGRGRNERKLTGSADGLQDVSFAGGNSVYSGSSREIML